MLWHMMSRVPEMGSAGGKKVNEWPICCLCEWHFRLLFAVYVLLTFIQSVLRLTQCFVKIPCRFGPYIFLHITGM